MNTDDPYLGLAKIRGSDVIHIEHKGRKVEVTISPKGTPVLAFPGLRQGRAILTKTRTPAWVLGGTPVVSVEDYPGGIALTHIEIIPEES